MEEIKIVPFPNWEITPEAFQNDVVGNSSDTKSQKQKMDGSVMVIVNEFQNGERRVNFMVPETNNGKTFMSIFPDPIQLYYSFAIKAFASSEELRNKEFIKASRQINGEEKYFLDVTSDETHPLYNSYLQFKIGSIIMLACSVEAFVNSIITESITYTSEKGKELDQDGIQRWLPLKEKIEKVIPQIYSSDFKDSNKNEFDQINFLIRIRNEFVHLKNYNKSPFSDEYQQLFLSLKKFNIKASIEAVKIYMNNYKPNFIVEK
jgi:hypothetical protein